LSKDKHHCLLQVKVAYKILAEQTPLKRRMAPLSFNGIRRHLELPISM